MAQKTVYGVLRAAAPRDVDRIVKFYRDANDPNVLPRPASELERAAEQGHFFLIEIDGKIRAGAGAFDLAPNLLHKEVGSCYVSPEVRGFDLQGLLLRVRVASLTVTESPMPPVLSAVKPANGHSLNNLRRAGFEPWPDPVAEVLDPCHSCPSKPPPGTRPCCCDFLILPDDQRRQLVKEIAATEAWVKVREDRQIHINYVCRVLTDPNYIEAMQQFARGEWP